MNNHLWHNGTFKKHDTAIFTAHDRIRLGDGVFDTMLIDIKPDTAAKLIHAERHFTRLLNDANVIGITGTLPTQIELEAAAEALIIENDLTPARYALNTIISHGPAVRGLKAPKYPEPQLIMRISPIPNEFPPANAVIAKTVRRNEGSPLSRIKSCNYGDNILALNEATARGANEAVMLNNQGHVTCATSGNIFAMINGALTTPPLEDGVMNGITRARLIEHMDIHERSITAEDLEHCEGAFITNSLRGVIPVVSLNTQVLPAPSLPIDKDFHLE